MEALPSLNDAVDDIINRLWDDPQYKALTSALWDDSAVEGSLAADNYKAADLIRETAKSLDENHMVAQKNLATIVKAHGVVLRRYGLDRKTRRSIIA